MVSYTFLDAILDLIGLASTAAVVFWLVTGLEPGFKRVRDSCRAGKPPEGRGQLLWSSFLIPIVWEAAAALYLRNLFSLWDIMGSWLESQPVNRPVYALLHLYLYFLLLCGIYACTVTIVEISRNGQVFGDLLMIARFGTNGYHLVEDTEAQHGSSAPGQNGLESETASAVNVRNTTSPPRNEGLRNNGQGFSESVAPTCSFGRIGNERKTVEPPKPRQIVFELDDHNTSSSSTTSSVIDEPKYAIDDNDRQILPLAKLREYLEAKKQSPTNGMHSTDQRGCLEGADDDDTRALYHATPRLRPRHQNAKVNLKPLDIVEPQSPCDSCSSAHARSIPTAKRSPARVPITPTTPTVDAEDADTEKTDVERKKRDGKRRGGWAMPDLQMIPRADNEPKVSAPHGNNNIGEGEDESRDLPSKPTFAQILENRALRLASILSRSSSSLASSSSSSTGEEGDEQASSSSADEEGEEEEEEGDEQASPSSPDEDEEEEEEDEQASSPPAEAKHEPLSSSPVVVSSEDVGATTTTTTTPPPAANKRKLFIAEIVRLRPSSMRKRPRTPYPWLEKGGKGSGVME